MASIDRFKLIHWLNIRKTTFVELNRLLKKSVNQIINYENTEKLDAYSVKQIATVLKIPADSLLKSNKIPNYLHMRKEEINATKRPITRDGIHFYNYYTLPSPEGFVAPVLIDILCPKNKLPKLNNGHLETAITLSLGPNDIYARFEKKINKTNFCKFKINKDKKTSWIVGDNYYEPSYCLHTYSRASDGPGKILSYTTVSHVNKIFRDKFNDDSFKNFLKRNDKKNYTRNLFLQSLEDRGYDLNYVSKKTNIKINNLKNFFKEKCELTKSQKKKIFNLASLDERLYHEIKHKEDKVGKLYFSVSDVKKTIRKYKSYTIASIASSTRNPDLYGYFMSIKKKNTKSPKLDLQDSNCSHYLVTRGNLFFFILDKDRIKKINCSEGDAIWVSSYIEHAFYGKGALAKISDGQNFNYLEKFDLGNLYKHNKTFVRARKDIRNWGYDK
jgi:hypothetical protein